MYISIFLNNRYRINKSSKLIKKKQKLMLFNDYTDNWMKSRSTTVISDHKY